MNIAYKANVNFIYKIEHSENISAVFIFSLRPNTHACNINKTYSRKTIFMIFDYSS